MKAYLLGGLLAGVLLLTGGTAMAHHSFAAEFDATKRVTLTGVVTKVEWTNPHVWIYFNVKDEKGEVKQWGAETVGPAALRQAGFLRGPASLRIGDLYTFEGFAARDGGERIFTTAIHFPDGRKIQLWFGDASGNR